MKGTVLATVIAVSLSGPAANGAGAASLDMSCAQAADVLASGTPSDQYLVVGQTIGTAGLLANLLCFVGDERCACFQDILDGESARNDTWATEISTIVAACAQADPNRSLSGISQQAALVVCPSE